MRRSLLFLGLAAWFLAAGGRADDFDNLRIKWGVFLNGGTNLDLSDPTIASRVTSLGNSANSAWNSMDKSAGRTNLWADAGRLNQSEDITASYNRLRSMALGWATAGSPVFSNAALAADIVSGLDWMYTNRYNETRTSYDNWWDWEIGSPMALNDCMVLMYPVLSGTQITNYCAAIDKFAPTVNMTGANRIWKADVVGLRGVNGRNSAKVAAARDGLSDVSGGGANNVFKFVTTSDGFYRDGSFIQHGKHPYTAGYGISHFHDSIKLVYWLEASPWAVTDPLRTNIYNWVYKSYEPLIYRGAMPSFVRGREISRQSSTGDYGPGRSAINGMLQLSVTAPPADAARIKSMLKYFDAADTQVTLPDFVPLHLVTTARSLLADTNVVSRGPLIGHYAFPAMDRVMHLRPGFGFGLAMFSTRIYNYESINTENLKGWYTAEGTTWLYNDDLTQFTDSFWPTVDPYHLPGTTVDLVPRANSWGQTKTTSQNWVGGSVLEGTYGVAGMAFAAIDSTSTLTARKSWFLFDDEIVCLGAGISAGGTNAVHTTVENRRLNSSGNNALTANGASLSTALGWNSNFTALSWCSIAGAGGYFFPEATSVQASRYARTGRWYDINILPQPTATLTNPITRNYLSLIINHGVAPAGASYAYALLPNMTDSQVSAYAAAPEIQILENTTQAQAVREQPLGLLAVNFWEAAAKTVDFITCSNRTSVITREAVDSLVVAVSDPTQTNTGTISLTLARAASSVAFADTNVTVTRLTPTIQVNVSVNGRKGQSSSVKFLLATNTAPIIPEVKTQRVSAGDWFDLLVPGYDPDLQQQSLRYELVSGPPGAGIDPATGRLQWMAALPEGASNLFTVRVTETGWATNVGPVADTYVQDGGLAALNFGLATNLAVKLASSGFLREAYLRFALPPMRGYFTNAELALLPLAASLPGGHAVAVAGDNLWQETNLTYNTRPAAGPLIASWQPEPGRTNRIPLTAAAQAAANADDLLSLRVYATNSTADGLVQYGSREGAPAFAPRLYLISTDGMPLSATQSFWVVVGKSNLAPVLSGLSNRTVQAGAWLALQPTAADPDQPPQTLGYRLLNAPPGAAIDATTGAVTWRPAANSPGAAHLFTVEVRETGWQTNVPPVADAYVQNGTTTNTSFGTGSALVVKAGSNGYGRESYLKFNLPGLPGELEEAELWLKCMQSQTPAVHATTWVADDTWSETTLTWNNKPASGPDLASWLPQVGQWMTGSVFSAAQSTLLSDGVLSLRVYPTTSTADGYVSYASREAASTNRPWLRLASTNLSMKATTQSCWVTVLPTPPPRLASAGWNGDLWQMDVSGVAGPDYTILAATNVIGPWEALFTTNFTGGGFRWWDPDSSHHSRRFYRVALGPPG